jgi:hypothetical protein
MYTSIPWASALGVACVMAVVVGLGIATRRGVIAGPERGLAHVAHLLGGGLTGFLAIAFLPAWPLLAAVVGMLVVRGYQARRILDIGLLLLGFGSAWTLLFGFAVVNEMTDPAIYAPSSAGELAFAVAVLAAGVAVALIGLRRPRAPHPPSSASG